jgi:hypothetical protein
MYSQADGFIAPCLFGVKEKKTAFVLYDEGGEDIIIQSHNIPSDIVSNGGRIRLFGEIFFSGGYKEMSVERFQILP